MENITTFLLEKGFTVDTLRRLYPVSLRKLAKEYGYKKGAAKC